MTESQALKELEKILGYEFNDISVLKMALTHRSYRYEEPNLKVDNQRLEFLGDAVLGFVTASYLYDKNRNDNEGVLTCLRSQVTSGKALADIARKIRVGRFLLLGRGEELSGGRERSSNLADAFEAILGAVYIDGGIEGVKKVFARHFLPVMDNLDGDVLAANPKGKLQKLVQSKWKTHPVYRLVDKDGAEHAAVFTVEVDVNNKCVGHGVGRSKQAAERAAAIMALEKLENKKG